jgi:hypothetical protein
VGALRLLRLGFDFLDKIEPAQPLDAFFFFLLFFATAFEFGDAPATGSEMAESGRGTCSSEDTADLARGAGNSGDEHELIGRDRVGEFAPLHGSRPKNDHRLGVFTGLGSAGPLAVSVGSGSDTRRGIELRRLGTPAGSLAITPGDRSRTAPAVLGLDSPVLRDGLLERGTDGISRSAVVEGVSEMIDVMLPDTECPPGRAVTMLDVSLETSDKGRGMNSRVSENPTLACPLLIHPKHPFRKTISNSSSDATNRFPFPISDTIRFDSTTCYSTALIRFSTAIASVLPINNTTSSTVIFPVGTLAFATLCLLRLLLQGIHVLRTRHPAQHKAQTCQVLDSIAQAS